MGRHVRPKVYKAKTASAPKRKCLNCHRLVPVSTIWRHCDKCRRFLNSTYADLYELGTK